MRSFVVMVKSRMFEKLEREKIVSKNSELRIGPFSMKHIFWIADVTMSGAREGDFAGLESLHAVPKARSRNLIEVIVLDVTTERSNDPYSRGARSP